MLGAHAALDLAHGHHRRILGEVHLAAHDRLQRGDDVRRDDDRVGAVPRIPAVRLLALHQDPVVISARVRAARHVENVVHQILGADVQRETRIHRRVGEHSFLHHQLRSALLTLRRTFLGGLEHELHRPRELGADACEHLGHPHQDRDVRVVPAGVHDPHLSAVVAALRGGGKRKLHPFRDRQRVHVGAQEHDWPRFAALQESDHAGMRDTGRDVDAERSEMIGDELRGAHLTVAQLRMLMNVTPPCHDLRLDGADPRLYLGGECGCLPNRGCGQCRQCNEAERNHEPVLRHY